jgi:hypothetical protein
MPIPVPVQSKVWVAATCLLGLWVQISPGAWMSASCESRVLSDRGLLCVGLVTHPKEFYHVWCVEMSVNMKPQ